MPDRCAALNRPLDALRAMVLPEAGLDTPLPPGLALQADPAAGMAGRWQSPRGRLLELEALPEAPGRWFGLHLALPSALWPDDRAEERGPGEPPPEPPPGWIGFAARTAAGSVLGLRACLRSGLPEGGFHDAFFDRPITSEPAETDHLDMMAPDRRPDLPRRAPWREFILFLPPDRGLAWALHDLRLFRL